MPQCGRRAGSGQADRARWRGDRRDAVPVGEVRAARVRPGGRNPDRVGRARGGHRQQAVAAVVDQDDQLAVDGGGSTGGQGAVMGQLGRDVGHRGEIGEVGGLRRGDLQPPVGEQRCLHAGEAEVGGEGGLRRVDVEGGLDGQHLDGAPVQRKGSGEVAAVHLEVEGDLRARDRDLTRRLVPAHLGGGGCGCRIDLGWCLRRQAPAAAGGGERGRGGHHPGDALAHGDRSLAGPAR